MRTSKPTLIASIVLAAFTAVVASACRTTAGDSQLHDAEEPAPAPEALAAAAKLVLEKHCVACHGPESNGDGGITYINDLAKLVEKKKVKRGTEADRAKSRVLVRLLDAESPMPPLETEEGTPIAVRPTAEEIKAVQDWIMADSPVPAAAVEPGM